MNTPNTLKYATSHEWLLVESDGTATIGITDHAQDLLGDLVFIELPVVGSTVSATQAVAVVESVKSASDVHAPISGTIIDVNSSLQDTPELLNQDAYSAWLFKIAPANSADIENLMDAAGYQASIDNA